MKEIDKERINKAIVKALKESKMAISAFHIQMRKLQALAHEASEAGENLKTELDKLVKEMEKENR